MRAAWRLLFAFRSHRASCDQCRRGLDCASVSGALDELDTTYSGWGA